MHGSLPVLEYFPMDTPKEPFIAPGGSSSPYPDPRVYSSLDYGNRVGAFRVFKALKKYGLKASVAFNSCVAQRYPFLLNEAMLRGWEVLAHGVDMAELHHGDLDIETERGYVQESLATLREFSGQPVTGWISPARSESTI